MDYKAKAVDSFNTKWDLFCFDYLVNKKDQFTIEEFKSFKIGEELVKVYSAQYHQYFDHESLDQSRINVGDLRKDMKELLIDKLKASCQNDYVANFESVFSKDKFEALGKGTKCYYCELEENEIKELYNKLLIYKKANRGFVLELDRKTANYEYTESNCVMACYWCNNAKTDEFNAVEFKPIGLAIGKALRGRIKISSFK